MDIGSLIEIFREEDTKHLENADALSEKCRLIQISDESDDEHVLPFFLEVLSDAQEYDLARIEILQILFYKVPASNDEYNTVAKLLRRLAKSDPDELIRSYAIMALESYIESEGSMELLEEIAMDKNEDENVRGNAQSIINMKKGLLD